MKNKNTRNTSLDFAKIIAALAVIMIHVSANFVTIYDSTTPEFFWGNILDSTSRIGVPLFVMISGALMLDESKEFPMSKLLKNIKNILFLFLFWSAFYVLTEGIIYPLTNGMPLDIMNLIISFIEGHFHMWYLYMLIGLYLITPFLRSFVNCANKNTVLLFIVIALLTQFTIPVANMLSTILEPAVYFNSFINQLYLNFFSGYTVYYLTGWYIVHVKISDKWKRCFLYATSIASVLLTIFYVYFTYDLTNGYSVFNLFIYLYAVGVFTIIVNLPPVTSNKLASLITCIANLGFGVYILHPFLQAVFTRTVLYTGQPLLYMFENFIFVSVGTFIICYIISKIPIIKKIIRL